MVAISFEKLKCSHLAKKGLHIYGRVFFIVAKIGVLKKSNFQIWPCDLLNLHSQNGRVLRSNKTQVLCGTVQNWLN